MFRGSGPFHAGVALALLGFTHLAWPHAAPADRAVLGWVEWITIEPWGLKIKSRLDTGANTASLHALRVRRFARRGEAWVHFTFAFDDATDEHGNAADTSIKVARPLERDVLIKRRDGGSERRPVVLMTFCLDGERHVAEFSLVDRSALNYPALLGRRFLADVAVVDPANAFRGSQACPPQ